MEAFIYGLAKKVLLADILGETAELIMTKNVSMTDAPIAWLGAVCYALQLYFDFSGYSEMAIGLGRMFGFEFQINFNHPYVSTSISEFWRRWHISLSQWFRDYLYIPMGGSRSGNVYLHLLIVFMATGIWHGASLGFIIWGLWHGLFVIIERYARIHRQFRCSIPAVIKWLYTMLVVLLGWILFRIIDVQETFYYYSIMFGVRKPDFICNTLSFYLNSRTTFALFVAILCCIPWSTVADTCFAITAAMLRSTPFVYVRRIFALALLVVCFLFIANGTYHPFIYFRF